MTPRRVAPWLIVWMLAACAPEQPAVPGPDATPRPPVADEQPPAPEPADRTQRKVSAGGLFVAELQPGETPVPLNRIHSWFVSVTAPDGTPVTGARLSFDGGMPAHDHGFPTQPRVHGETDAGRYRIDGVKFSMSGWWRMEMGIADGDRVDVVVFDLTVAP